MKVSSGLSTALRGGPCISEKLEEELDQGARHAQRSSYEWGYFWISALLSVNRRDDGRNYLGTEIGNHHVPCSSIWKDKSEESRSGGRDNEARNLSISVGKKRKETTTS